MVRSGGEYSLGVRGDPSSRKPSGPPSWVNTELGRPGHVQDHPPAENLLNTWGRGGGSGPQNSALSGEAHGQRATTRATLSEQGPGTVSSAHLQTLRTRSERSFCSPPSESERRWPHKGRHSRVTLGATAGGDKGRGCMVCAKQTPFPGPITGTGRDNSQRETSSPGTPLKCVLVTSEKDEST